MSGATTTPLYVEAGPDPIFGFLHQPAEARGPAVLICPPFGWDEICSYRPRRDWAEQLAAEGHPVLRFDFPGAGDSGGGPRDPGRLQAWTGAVAATAAHLREVSGAERILAIGTGLGGLMALRAAAEGAPVDDFVLWGVPARGKAMVRELKAFARLEEQESSVPVVEGPGAVPQGGMEAAGFLLSPETVAGLSELDVTALSLPDAGDRRVLLLDRDGIDPDPRLQEHLESAGAQVSVAPGPGYSSFIEEPQLARAPREVFATTSAWLTDLPSESPTAPAAPPELLEMAQVAAGESRVRETPFSVDHAGGRLFGVLAEPVDGPEADLCAVVLNAGAIRRIGSGRMWVETARRWSARGVPTLRLDLAGIGDADGDAEPYADTAALYAEELVPQVIEALDELGRRDMPQRFLLMGLCSGAYWSFHAALRDERVVAAFLLNPRALFWDSSLAAVRDVRKARWALEGSRWRRLLTGKVPLPELMRVVRATLRAPVTIGVQALKRRRKRREIVTAFDRLRDARQRVLFVFGEDEPVVDELERYGYLGQLARWPNTELRRLPGNNHTFRPLRAQHRVNALLDRELERELELTPGRDQLPDAATPS